MAESPCINISVVGRVTSSDHGCIATRILSVLVDPFISYQVCALGSSVYPTSPLSIHPCSVWWDTSIEREDEIVTPIPSKNIIYNNLARAALKHVCCATHPLAKPWWRYVLRQALKDSVAGATPTMSNDALFQYATQLGPPWEFDIWHAAGEWRIPPDKFCIRKPSPLLSCFMPMAIFF